MFIVAGAGAGAEFLMMDGGGGVIGSVWFLDSSELSSDRTSLSFCCSLMIFFRYFPWASIRN